MGLKPNRYGAGVFVPHPWCALRSTAAAAAIVSNIASCKGVQVTLCIELDLR